MESSQYQEMAQIARKMMENPVKMAIKPYL